MMPVNEKWRIEEICWYNGIFKRPREAGCNARLGKHGKEGETPLARIRSAGVYGFGWSRITPDQAGKLIGMPICAMFEEDGLVRDCFRDLEFPLLDWLGNMFHAPVYQLVGDGGAKEENEIKIPVYDTSIYFDELDIKDDARAVSFICDEVEQGMTAGHTNFKVKIGRCGMWMGIAEGLKRDVDIVTAIREKIGPDAKLMVDANNGYNLNLAKAFLEETKDAKLYWLEEPFHEDDQLLARLKEWMKERGIKTKIADGEGCASTEIEAWAKKGLIDILQYDLRDYGFCRWLRLNREISRYGILAAPHNYGSFYGNFVQAHFAQAVNNFTMGEWDQADLEGIDTSAYSIRDGHIYMKKRDGFCLGLDHERFEHEVQKNGWRIGTFS